MASPFLRSLKCASATSTGGGTLSSMSTKLHISKTDKVACGNQMGLPSQQSSTTHYNGLTNNCEHFACWCRNDWAVSKQVSTAPVLAFQEAGSANKALQVVRVAGQVVQLMVGLTTIKTRPVILLGMMWINQARKKNKL